MDGEITAKIFYDGSIQSCSSFYRPLDEGSPGTNLISYAKTSAFQHVNAANLG